MKIEDTLSEGKGNENYQQLNITMNDAQCSESGEHNTSHETKESNLRYASLTSAVRYPPTHQGILATSSNQNLTTIESDLLQLPSAPPSSSESDLRCVQRTSLVTLSSTEVLAVPLQHSGPFVASGTQLAYVRSNSELHLPATSVLDKSQNADENDLGSASSTSSNCSPDSNASNPVAIDGNNANFYVQNVIGHYDIIRSIAFDGNVIVTASRDTTVRVWNTEGRELFSLCGHSGEVTSVVLLDSSTSSSIATRFELATCRVVVSASTDCNLKLWNITNGRELKTIYTFNGITSLCWWDEAWKAVVGTDGGKVELWDVLEGCNTSSLKAHTELVVSVKVKEDTLVSAAEDFSIKVWTQAEGVLQLLNELFDVGGSCGSFLQCMNLSSPDTVLIGDEGTFMKEINLSNGYRRKYVNVIGNLGVTNAISVCGKLVLSSAYDMTSKLSFINGRRLEDNLGLQYLFSLKDEEESRILCVAAAVNEHGVIIVTGGNKLKIWTFNGNESSRPRGILVTTSFLPYLTCVLESETSEGSSLRSTDEDSVSRSSQESQDKGCVLM